MTLDELLRDENLRRREFPVTAHKVFLAHAGVTPLPRRTVEAMREYLSLTERNDQEHCFPPGRVAETRKLAARLIGCTPQEIALVGPTSLGLSLVAGGLDFPEASNVVCYRDDYPANVYPWRAIQERHPKVEVRSVKPQRLGDISLESVAQSVDENTRLVALASTHFVSGHRLDVAAIGKYLRERNILFCVDGIQSLGALRTTVEHVDFLAADAHKWLLGPAGAGVFYVRREVFHQLRPVLIGWNNAACPGFIAQDELLLPPHAGRYECGTANLAGVVGLHASLQLIEEIGIEVIERRLLALACGLIKRLKRKDYEMVGPDEGPALSGIVTCRKAAVDMAGAHARLASRNVITSLRSTRDGKHVLRFSPHFYNTDAELDQAVALLP